MTQRIAFFSGVTTGIFSEAKTALYGAVRTMVQEGGESNPVSNPILANCFGRP
jgi:hypothetical protein